MALRARKHSGAFEKWTPGRYVNEFIQIVLFFEQSSFKLRCETVIVFCYVACFTICTKLLVIVVFTFTFLNVIVASDFEEKNINGSRPTLLVFRTSNFKGETMRPILPSHTHSNCLYCSPIIFLPRASSKIIFCYFRLYYKTRESKMSILEKKRR